MFSMNIIAVDGDGLKLNYFVCLNTYNQIVLNTLHFDIVSLLSRSFVRPKVLNQRLQDHVQMLILYMIH